MPNDWRRKKRDGKRDEKRRKERSRILATLQYLYKYHWESLCALLPSVSPTLLPGNINFIIFFSCPLHAFYHFSRAPTKRCETRPCRMSQLVMRFSVLSLPPRVTTLMHARVVLYFSWKESRNFLSYSCLVRIYILQSKLYCRRYSNIYLISLDVRHQSFVFMYIYHLYEITRFIFLRMNYIAWRYFLLFYLLLLVPVLRSSC